MKHDPRQFGRANQAGWLLRARAERRRQARHAALIAFGAGIAFAIATGIAMHFGKEGAAALFATCSACLAVIAAAANSEA